MRALGKAVRQGFLPTCERSYRDFWLPMLDYNTPAYNNKTKEMPFEREPSVFFYSLPSVEHELLAPARQDTQPLPQLGSDGEEGDSDSEDESATKKMRLMAQSTLPYTSRESDVDEKEDKEDEREEEKEKDNDESDKEEGKEEGKEEVETDKEDEEEEEEEGNDNSTEEEKEHEEKQDEEKQEDKDKEDK